MFVVCKIQNCGYCSDSGFCLNRLLVIQQNGVCKRLTENGWDRPVEDRFKNNYHKEETKQEKAKTEQEKEKEEEEYIEYLNGAWGNE